LASEYGWSKAEILETVYIDEVPELERSIKKRRAEKKIEELEMVLAPHSDRQHKMQLFNRYRKQLLEATLPSERQDDDQLDRAGVQRLRGLAGGKGKAGNK